MKGGKRWLNIRMRSSGGRSSSPVGVDMLSFFFVFVMRDELEKEGQDRARGNVAGGDVASLLHVPLEGSHVESRLN